MDAEIAITRGLAKALLSCSSSWLSVCDQLQAVTSNTQVGKLMFGWAWQGVRSEKVSQAIEVALAQLQKEKKITEVSFNTYRSRCWDAIKQVDADLASFVNLGTIAVVYRGVDARVTRVLDASRSTQSCIFFCVCVW